ncbi:hypothetical protein B9Z19DRAFT_1149641 [Tuber borchii]|uniref:Uncharacterized protein n=1 Tax=Tuber borchii TaxID=42251 RepID=A0A2T7A5F2_TUBBO|nr:hypothetical protein B9Z19DRAFT_1149641 [Tuber borchii]
MNIEDAVKKTQAEIAQQGAPSPQFLCFGISPPISDTVKEFGGGTPKLSLPEFWLNTALTVLGMVILAGTVIIWKRPYGVELRTYLKKKSGLSPKEQIGDPERLSPREQAPNSA